LHIGFEEWRVRSPLFHRKIREGTPLFDILQPAFAGLYSGAIHPTAEAHAIVADHVVRHVRKIVDKPEPKADAKTDAKTEPKRDVVESRAR